MKKILLLLTVAACFFSCNKFLEMKSPSEYVPKNTMALSEMLLGSGYPNRYGSLFVFNNFLSDDVSMNYEIILNEAQEANLVSLKALYAWHPDMEIKMLNPSYLDNWSEYYKQIKGCNAVFDYINTVEGTEAEKNKIMAEAYTLRAFYYLNLVNLYAKPYSWDKNSLGVPLKLTSEIELKHLPRNTVAEVYDQIVADLLEAEKLFMTLSKEERGTKSLRISLPATQILLSRTYLYMERWSDVDAVSKRFIKENPSFVLSDLNKFEANATTTYPSYASLSNSETIWVYAGTGFSGIYNVYGSTLVKDEIYEWEDPSSAPAFGISKDLINSYEDGDLRRNYYFVKVWDFVNKKPIKKEMYYAYGKMDISNTNSPVFADGKFGLSFRVSELYLNYAEALVKLGGNNESVALNYINQIRKNRFVPDKYKEISGLTGELLLSLVKKERRCELCLEVTRWYDLRRWNESYTKDWIVNDQVANKFTIDKNDPAYILPIHSDVLKSNSSLKQNEKTVPKF